MALRDTVERLRNTRAPQSDPAELVLSWQTEVARLYDTIADWLAPYIDDGGIVLERHTVSVYEEATGDYEIDRLDIDVGDETVTLEPKGTIVIGARGRIDVSRLGSGQVSILILTGLADDSNWSIVQPSYRLKLTPLTKDAFEVLLDKLLEPFATYSDSAM